MATLSRFQLWLLQWNDKWDIFLPLLSAERWQDQINAQFRIHLQFIEVSATINNNSTQHNTGRGAKLGAQLKDLVQRLMQHLRQV